jgi:hypothetical protein
MAQCIDRRKDHRMPTNTAEDIYELVRQMPVSERLRLVEKIAHDLVLVPAEARSLAAGFRWSELAGVAPGLLGGEDAQAWVSSSRLASDEHRAELQRREP